MSCSFIIGRRNEQGRGRITGLNNGKPFAVEVDHLNYDKIVAALREEKYSALDTLLDIPTAITRVSGGNVEIKDEVVYYKGTAVHNVLTQKLLDFMRDGLPFKPLMKFFDNLMSNPSFRAQKELYPFLERNNLPITEDGCFVGYKGVRNDYYDIHSGKYLNTPGAIIQMVRNTVDDNYGLACSEGLHVGSFKYADSFRNGGKLMSVKVNPADVVSVPDYEDKLRTCKYEVLSEITGLGAFTTTMYNQDSVVNDEYEDDYMDDDYDDMDDYEEDDEDEVDDNYCEMCGGPCTQGL